MTRRYTLRDLLAVLARLLKPATDAAAVELAAMRTPAAGFVAGPVAAVEPATVAPAAVLTLPPVAPAPVVPPAIVVPESAAASAVPAVSVPSMAPWLDAPPIGKKPAARKSAARKLATRKPAAAVAAATVGSTPRGRATTPRDATGTHGTTRFDAAARTVTIAAGRSTCRYAVTETPTDWDGRAFELRKLDAGSDPDAAVYSVFVCRRGDAHRCDCKGFERGNGKPCRHVNALKALAAAGRV